MLANHRQRVVQVRCRLGVDGDAVRSGLCHRLDLALGSLDHQVHVDDRAAGVHALGDRLDDQRTERDRRNEVAVHHVDVDHPRPGPHHLIDLAPEPGEVSRKDRRRQLAACEQRLPVQWLDRPQHAAVAVIALHDRGAGHANDRRMLAAVGANRHKLVAVQAVDAAVAAGNCGRAQPRLAAVGALEAELDGRAAHRVSG
jgi:hypothetical protein